MEPPDCSAAVATSVKGSDHIFTHNVLALITEIVRVLFNKDGPLNSRERILRRRRGLCQRLEKVSAGNADRMVEMVDVIAFNRRNDGEK